MKIYLAGPFWTDEQRTVIRALAQMLRADDNEVYVPMEHEVPNAWAISNAEWAEKVWEADCKAIDEADLVVACVYGYTDDSGTAWECGYAFAKGKNVHLVNCGDDKSVHSLMMWCSSVNFGEDEISTLPELK